MDFTYNKKTISMAGPLQTTGRNIPINAKCRVEHFSDIYTIPTPAIGELVYVLHDENNDNKPTLYVIVSLKANEYGVENVYIDKIETLAKFLGVPSLDGINLSDYYNKLEVDELLANKVSIKAGESLFTDEERAKLESLSNYDDTEIKQSIESKADEDHNHAIEDVTGLQSSLSGKVDKVEGMGLSQYNFDFAAKNKLDYAATIADVKNMIADAKLDGADGIDISGLASKVDLEGKADKDHTHTAASIEGLSSRLNSKVDKVEGKSLVDDDEMARLRTLSNYDDTDVMEALDNKVDKVEGKSLVDNAEIARLRNVNNYDDTTIKSSLNNKVDKVAGKSLVDDDEIARLRTLSNYDDTALKNSIASKANIADVNKKVDKVEGKSLVDNTEIARLRTLFNYDDTLIRELINEKFAQLDAEKVDAVPGKVLSDNNLTDALLAELNNAASKSYVQNAILQAEMDNSANAPDLSGLATKDELSTKANIEHNHRLDSITGLLDALASKVNTVEGKSLVDDAEISRLRNVNNYDDTELRTKIDNIIVPTDLGQLTNGPGYLTSVPAEYVTNRELNNKGYLTEHQDISHLATKEELDDKANIDDVYTKAEVDAEITEIVEQLDPNSLLPEFTEADAGKALIIGEDGTTVEWGASISDATADFTSNTALGNIRAGTNLSGLSAIEILKMAVVAYVNPTASVSYNQANTIIEQGQSFNLTITVSNINKGTSDVAQIVLYKAGAVVQTIPYVTGTNSYSFDTIEDIAGSVNFEVRVIDVNNKYNSYTKSYTFVNPIYHGSDPNDPVELTTATKLIQTKGDKTITYNASNEYIYFMYPKSYGSLRSILDSNGFENIGGFVITERTIDGVVYYSYVTGKVTTTGFKLTYKF